MCRMLKIWKKQVLTSTLPRAMREYWKVFHRLESIGCHRGEQLVFLKKLIKKKLPRQILPSKVWFYAVEKITMFNPLLFHDSKKYLETLMLWRVREMKKFIQDNPRLLIKGYRHKKVAAYKKPLRV